MYYPCSENKGADQLRRAKLICVFVFAYADCWFSPAAALLKSRCPRNNLPILGSLHPSFIHVIHLIVISPVLVVFICVGCLWIIIVTMPISLIQSKFAMTDL